VRSRVAAGSQLATLGLIALLLALVVRPRRWPIVTGAGLVAMGAGAAIALPPLAVDAYPTTYLRPGVPYVAASVNQGRALYRQHCLPCHGAAGYGDGAAGAGLPRRPADLTAPHVADHTAGDLFWWISQGVPGGGMPGMAAGLSAEERWDVVNFVRTLGASERARELGPVPSTRPVAVAPDFAYTVGVGAERALRDLRGRAVVLLAFFSLPASGERLATLARAYPAVRAAGGEILAIPVGVAGGVYRALARALGEQVAYFPVVIEGAAEAARAYALFRRDFSGAGLEADPSPPAHMELLVDRQGYLRARWLPREAGDVAGWSDPDRLVQAIERLTLETPQVPAAAVHVH
jgi:putative copper resistance protein D